MVTDNNGRASVGKALSITINPALPDLIVSTVSGPASATRGTSVTVTATVVNQGAGSAAASTLTFYLSIDNAITTADTKLGDKAIAVLGAGASLPVSVSFTIFLLLEIITRDSNPFWFRQYCFG